jgi:hypothetical protein
VAEGSERRRTEPPQFSEGAPVAVGTAVWALLFVIGLVIRGTLIDSGREWWIWTAAAGVVLGLVGYLYMMRRQAHLTANQSGIGIGAELDDRETIATPESVEPATDSENTGSTNTGSTNT